MSDVRKKKSDNGNGDGVVKPIAIYYEQPQLVCAFVCADGRARRALGEVGRAVSPV